MYKFKKEVFMRLTRHLIIIAAVIAANFAFAGSVVTQRVVNAQAFVKGSTTIALSGQLTEEAMARLSNGEGMAIYNSLDSYLVFPTLLPRTKAGFGTKSKTQNISVSSKNGKFQWTEKDVTDHFTFAVGYDKVFPEKATFKSSGNLPGSALAELGEKKLTVFDTMCAEQGLGYLASLSFVPEKKGKNYQFSLKDKEQGLQVKVSVNAKGKASASYKLPPAFATPAVLDSEYVFTNKYDYSLEVVGNGSVEAGFVGPDLVELKVTDNLDKFRYFTRNGEKITEDSILVDLEEDTDFTAVFGNYDLTVTVSGDGSVETEFVGPDEVVVTAFGGKEYFYSFELGDAIYFENPLTFTMTEDTELLATFKEAKYVVIDLFGGKDSETWPVRFETHDPDVDDDACRTTEIWLKYIVPGEFQMGSPDTEVGRYDDEDQHKVTLTKGFFIGLFEVTQAQFELVAGYNNSRNKGYDRPVEMVSYDDIAVATTYVEDEKSFLGILRKKTGFAFDLPTEAQWEFACRAGSTNALYTGYEITENVRCTNVAQMCRYRYNQDDGKGGYEKHTRVGSYPANPWGLYDMCGNVWEWTKDFYGAYNLEPQTDPEGPEEGFKRILRGGSFAASAQNCRSARRRSYDPDRKYDGDESNFGFRLSLQ